MRKHWIFGLVVLVWCSIIYSITASPASTSNNTRSIIRSETNVSPAAVSQIDRIVRKVAHVTLFGGLAVVLQLALWKRAYSTFLAWLLASLGGAADEFHQMFVPNRTPSLIDVGIDSWGACMALLLFHLVYRLGNKFIQKSNADF